MKIKKNEKKLSKSQIKKLQKVIDKRRKKKNLSEVLEELKKHQLSDDHYSKLTPRFGSKSKGFKREKDNPNNISAAKIYCSGKNKKISDAFNEKSVSSSFEVMDLELSSSEEELEDENFSNQALNEKNIDLKLNSNSFEETEILKNFNAESLSSNEFLSKNKKRKKLKKKNIIKEAIAKEPVIISSKFVPVFRTQEMINARNKLPVICEESNLIDEIKSNPVVIVCGETGSGKTTQIPQFLYEHGFAENKQIVITQPRRVAAISMSKRIAHEMNLGEDVVSYQIRHSGNVTDQTKIKFLTDGVLMKELQKDVLLSKYSVVIIDEAHERSIYSDILIGLLSRIIKLREQRGDFFRMIIMSATLRITDFTENKKLFKTSPPVIQIQTRQYPIQTNFAKTTPQDYLKEAYKKVCKIHQKFPLNGGILVFVSGRKEVNTLVSKLRQTFEKQKIDKDLVKNLNTSKKQKNKKENTSKLTIKDLIPDINLDDLSEKNQTLSLKEENSDSDISEDEQEIDDSSLENINSSQPLYCLPLYSMLNEKEQKKVFDPPPQNSRLCVIATNVAETSLTIPNIKYVVDTGKTKNKVYDKTTGIYTYLVEWCSKSSANQRAGRSGRCGPGFCFRLYSSAVYNNDFKEFPEAEILKKPLDDLVIQLKSMYIDKINNFPFPSTPDLNNLEVTEKRLILLGALEKKIVDLVNKTECTVITNLGKIISVFPVSPRYGKMLAISIQQDLLDYAIAIVSLMTIQEIFDNEDFSKTEINAETNDTKIENSSVNKKQKLLENNQVSKKKSICSNDSNKLGDIMSLLKACFLSEINGNSLSFCKRNNLRHKAMLEVNKLRKQLIKEINENFSQIKITTNLKDIKLPTEDQSRKLRQLLLICFNDHIARKSTNQNLTSSDKIKLPKNSYMSIELENPVFISDKSVLKQDLPDYVVYQEIFENNKLFMRTVVSIEENWIPIYANKLCNFSKPLEHLPPIYDEKTDQIKCYTIPTFGPYSWKLPQTMIEYPESNEKYKYFTQFLLEGEILKYFKKFNEKSCYISSPKIITKSWGRLKEAPTKLLNVLIQNRISTKFSLLKKFESQPAFLLEEFKNCLVENERDNLQLSWPPTN